jgi:pantetheine-phosphate adenylyltransferase
MAKQYRHLGLGGTFDHFHIGHEHFLKFTAQLAETIHVGVTIPELTKNKIAAQTIEPLETRIKAVKDFLKRQDISAEVFPLENQFGPTLENSSIQAVAVTEATVAGAQAINSKRKTLQLPELPVHVCTLLRDRSGECISSTRIRTGQINRHGEIYAQILSQGIVLSAAQKLFFREIQGELIKTPSTESTDKLRIVVGDIVTETFLKEAWPFQLAVFDYKTKAAAYESPVITAFKKQLPTTTTLQNAAGEISAEVVTWSSQWLNTVHAPSQSDALHIEGEEDLVTVALAALAPLGTYIYYGQPNRGIVELFVTEELKQRFLTALFPSR